MSSPNRALSALAEVAGPVCACWAAAAVAHSIPDRTTTFSRARGVGAIMTVVGRLPSERGAAPEPPRGLQVATGVRGPDCFPPDMDQRPGGGMRQTRSLVLFAALVGAAVPAGARAQAQQYQLV